MTSSSAKWVLGAGVGLELAAVGFGAYAIRLGPGGSDALLWLVLAAAAAVAGMGAIIGGLYELMKPRP